jgi:exopolyphosphatase/guanosine-5'-triphosphate,3'-diphosphate pyrophosphatase
MSQSIHNHAAIEIGSASLDLMIMNHLGEIICDESRDTGLGVGQGGLLPREQIQDTIDALSELIEVARLNEIPVWRIQAVASSALRKAFNAKTILQRIHQELGLEVYLLSMEEEGSLAWQGASCGIQLPEGSVAVVDLGGSSVEAVCGTPNRMLQQQSFRLGYISITDRFFGTPARYDLPQVSKMNTYVDSQLRTLEWSQRPRVLIAVGAVAMAIASMERGLLQHDPAQIHGLRLSRGMLRKWNDRILEKTPQKRRDLCPAYPNKADYLLAACTVLESICTYSMRDSLLISGGGLRLGVLLQSLDADEN